MSSKTTDHALQIGDVVGNTYEVTGELQSGGMGVIYSGRHLRLQRRNVAIKVIKTSAHSSEAQHQHLVQRFNLEAQVVAGLDHPNVVPVYDFGALPTGQPYMVMELLTGHDLEHELKARGPMDRERAVRLFLGALEGLAVAHRAGIVHKDLKPANLFIKHAGTERERICVLDFGIARVTDDELLNLAGVEESSGRASPRRVTQTGGFTGTCEYAAPEYANLQQATPAVDVYQMGLILAEALTGEPVVDTSVGIYQALMVHIQGKIDIPALVREDGELGPIVVKATSHDPKDRYADASGMREAIVDAFANHANATAILGAPSTLSGMHTPLQRPTTLDATPEPTPAAPSPAPATAAPAPKPRGASWAMGLAALTVAGLVALALTLGAGFMLLKGWQSDDAIHHTTSTADAPSGPQADATEAGAAAAKPEDDDHAAPQEDLDETMALIPAGSFMRGDAKAGKNERPVNEISLKAFRIDRMEVTVAQYARCVEAGACPRPFRTHKRADLFNWGAPGRERHPINGVNWIQATAYCAWAGKRLPTEAEWELAARGPESRRFPWGDEAPDCERAVFEGCGEGTREVGSLNSDGNAWGLHDMAGNVWEWTADWYEGDYYRQAPTQDPRGPEEGKLRAYRGGGWLEAADGLRGANRNYGNPNKGTVDVGFRCAKSPQKR